MLHSVSGAEVIMDESKRREQLDASHQALIEGYELLKGHLDGLKSAVEKCPPGAQGVVRDAMDAVEKTMVVLEERIKQMRETVEETVYGWVEIPPV